MTEISRDDRFFLNTVQGLCINIKAKSVLMAQIKFLRGSVNTERADFSRNKNPLISEKIQWSGSFQPWESLTQLCNKPLT